MSIALPTIDLVAIEAAASPVGKALFAKLSMSVDLLNTAGHELCKARTARDNAASIFESSTHKDDVEAREVRARGMDKVDQLREQIARIESDIEAVVTGRVSVNAESSVSPDDIAVWSSVYESAVKDLTNFGKSKPNKAIYPELTDIKFPNVVQLITGKGALRTSDGESTKRFRVYVDYNGERFDSISLAAVKAGVDNTMVTAQVVRSRGDSPVGPGESFTVHVTDNGTIHEFAISGKVTAKPGRKVTKSADDSAVVDADPTDEELAAAETADMFTGDDDDEDDEDFA